MKLRKLTSWLLAASMVVGFGLSATPALAEDGEYAEEVIVHVDLSATDDGPMMMVAADVGDVTPVNAAKTLANAIVGSLIASDSSDLHNFKYWVSNASGTFSGGSFDGDGSGNLANGILLTTGKAANVKRTRNQSSFSDDNSGDEEALLTTMLRTSLDSYYKNSSSKQSDNASILEFEFRPKQSGTISFPFVFGSKEFGRTEEVSCGKNCTTQEERSRNDGFYFLLSKGRYAQGNQKTTPLTAADNIAVVPNKTDMISVHTINDRTNSEYYVPHDGSKLNLDGYTRMLMTKEAEVQANEWYTVRVAIADYDSSKYDSVVFVGAANFTPSTPPDTAGPIWDEPEAITVVEQCDLNSVVVSWPQATDSSTPVSYHVWVNGAQQQPQPGTSLTWPTQPGVEYTFEVIAKDSMGNGGDPLTKTFTAGEYSAEQIKYLGSGSVGNGGVYDIRFQVGTCVGAELDETVAVKLRDSSNKLIAGYVYGQSIQFNGETMAYSQSFDTGRFNVKDTVVKIFVYFGNKLKDTFTFTVGNP